MTEKPKYYDIREGFWRKHFERAASFDRFLEEGDPAFAERWCKNMAALPGLCPEDRARLSGHNREVNVLVYCAAWCGDCARQIPMVKMIAEAVGPGAKMRLIDRDESEELKDELRILGAMRVPVVVFLTEDFHEIGRVGDRMRERPATPAWWCSPWKRFRRSRPSGWVFSSGCSSCSALPRRSGRVMVIS